MITTTIEDFNKDVKKYIDRVSEDLETLIVNSGNDNGVVIMSLVEYNSYNATFHELSSEKNTDRLNSAITKIAKRDFFEKDLALK